jgi:hypothetical protein
MMPHWAEAGCRFSISSFLTGAAAHIYGRTEARLPRR